MLVILSFWFIKTIHLYLHFLIKSHAIFYDIMGNYITIPVSSSNNIHTFGHYDCPSNLKFDSQNIIKFLGRIEDWHKFKLRTECDFDGSGYDQVLSNAIIAVNN